MRVFSPRGSHRPVLSIRAGGFLELAELIDLHLALGEHGFDLQLASHGADHGLQSTDVHIGAALHLGDCGLVDAEQLGQMLLSHFSGFSGAKARNILALTARLKSCPPQTPCHPEQSVRSPVEFEVGLKLLYGCAS
jgi:hypothetical protein